MPNQTPASNSDARKRNAERDQPGSLSPTGPTSPTSTYSNTTNADLPPVPGAGGAATEAEAHTYDPETHVLVERALIDEYEAFVARAKDIVKYQTLGYDVPIVQDLAALADGAES